DVTVSEWECTLEKVGSDSIFRPELVSTWHAQEKSSLTLLSRSQSRDEKSSLAPSLRLGLRMIAGLSEAGAQRIVEARRAQPFVDVTDLAHRAALDRRDLARLADADALAALAGHRHGAVWDVAGVEHLPPLLAGGSFDEMHPDLPAPTEGQDIVADYRTLSLTLRRHPLALLRKQLRKRRLLTSAEIARDRKSVV